MKTRRHAQDRRNARGIDIDTIATVDGNLPGQFAIDPWVSGGRAGLRI